MTIQKCKNEKWPTNINWEWKTMKNFDRITVDPAVMNGQPCIKGTRLTVRRTLLILAQYTHRDELHKDYPQLQEEDIHQALEYAAANLEDEIVDFRSAS